MKLGIDTNAVAVAASRPVIMEIQKSSQPVHYNYYDCEILS